jgi:hypothetical protein
MSARYQALVALLDDPVNRACVQRELLRRDRNGGFRPLLPPIPREGGGWVWPTFRESLRKSRPAEYPREAVVDSAFEVYTDGEGWFGHSHAGDLEVGPFDSDSAAVAEVRNLALEQGYVLLAQLPWEEEDTDTWPIGRR